MSPAPAHGAEHTRPYVVVYDTGPRAPFSAQAETAARERAYGFSSTHRFRHAIDGFAANLTDADARALRADPAVALVAPDRMLRAARVPLAVGESVPTGVARIGAAAPSWVHAPSGVAVAVLDTGIDLTHPDLAVHAGANCTGAGPPQDEDGHGTFVAGVVGARNDGAGVVGVAPGTELYAVKVLRDSRAGYVSEIICGIDWVTAYGPQLGIWVVNMSLSGSGPWSSCSSDPLHLAICRSVSNGIVYTVAAGNADPGLPPTDLAQQIPGSYPEVLTVIAMSDSDGAPGGTGAACYPRESDDSYATFSNYATRPSEIAHVVAAPGVCIESTKLGGGTKLGTGTSAAAPHVAGVVALCMGDVDTPGACDEMTSPEVIDQVRADAAANATPLNGFVGDPFRPLDRYFGHLASGADPTIRRIPPRPEPPTTTAAAPSQLDTVLEVLAMRIRRRQDVDNLSVVARLAEPGTVTARARVRLRGGSARLIVTRRAAAGAVPHETLRLRLRLPRAGFQRVKRALRRGDRVRARVTMTVSDSAGNSRTKKRRVRLRP